MGTSWRLQLLAIRIRETIGSLNGRSLILLEIGTKLWDSQVRLYYKPTQLTAYSSCAPYQRLDKVGLGHCRAKFRIALRQPLSSQLYSISNSLTCSLPALL